MARIPQITTKADLPADKQNIFDAITQSRGGIVGPFGILLNSPEVASRVAHLGHYLRFDSVLPADIRELAILTTARQMDSQYEWTAHVPLALQAGVRQEAIDAVGKRTAPTGLTPDEAMVVRFGQELWQQHKVSDTTFQSVLARFGKQGITELTTLMGYYSMVACVLNTFAVPLDPNVEPLLPQ